MLLSDQAARFVEAVSRLTLQRKQARIERQAERAFARVFAAQGKAMVKRLATLKPKFSEAVGVDDIVGIWLLVAEDTASSWLAPLKTTVTAGMQLGADHEIAMLGVDVVWDLTNEAAVAYLDERIASFADEVNKTTEEAIAIIARDGLKAGLGYDQVAKQISAKFADFAQGVGQDHLKSRAHRAAVSEFGNALSESSRQVAKTVQASGLKMQKAWITRGDSKVSDGCKANAKVGYIDLDEEYPSGHQRPTRFPGCRCYEEHRVAPDQEDV